MQHNFILKCTCKKTLQQLFICLRSPPILGFCFGMGMQFYVFRIWSHADHKSPAEYGLQHDSTPEKSKTERGSVGPGFAWPSQLERTVYFYWRGRIRVCHCFCVLARCLGKEAKMPFPCYMAYHCTVFVTLNLLLIICFYLCSRNLATWP
jgi:hypothetical protein